MPKTSTYAWLRQIAENERRRAATLEPGIYREDAKGWARELIGAARRERLKI